MDDALQVGFKKCNPVWAGLPRVAWREFPQHVIPVLASRGNGERVGLVVPLEVQPGGQWHVSDAFGRFGAAGASVQQAFEGLLKTLECAWRSKRGSVLPLAWRHPQEIRLGAPVHMEAIAGHSLQWPLVVALLRGCTEEAVLGEGPVFATGLVRPSGVIGEVAGLREKLEGFVREYGEGRVALITPRQRAALDARLLEKVAVHEVRGLGDLFALKEFAPAIEALSRAAAPQELDAVVMTMDREAAAVRFDRVRDMAEWALPCAGELPAYAFRVRMRRGSMLLHRGETARSGEDWRELRALLAAERYTFDDTDRAEFAAAVLTYLMDMGVRDAHAAEEWLDGINLEEVMRTARREAAAMLAGELSQFSRAVGELEQAVAFGERALRIAREHHLAMVGKYNNFVIHARLAQARAGGAHWVAALGDAARRLEASRGELAPAPGDPMRDTHLGFCDHYEAELRRLQGLPYTVRELGRPPGAWDHPYLFALLASARNRCNTRQQRVDAAERLVIAARDLRKWSDGPIFGLFLGIYEVVAANLRCEDIGAALGILEQTLEGGEEKGLAGWQARLEPALAALRSGNASHGVEALCDAIPHH